jgi:hypothetical protein
MRADWVRLGRIGRSGPTRSGIAAAIGSHGFMRCTSCNQATRVLDSRPRSDGATRRRRECLSCGRRFTTEELPNAAWLGELPESSHESGGPLEAVRRRAILSAARDANLREMASVVAEMRTLADEMRSMLDEAKEEAAK